jgi:hypothetical protein
LGKIVTLGSFTTLITSSLIALGVLLTNTQWEKPDLSNAFVFMFICASDNLLTFFSLG